VVGVETQENIYKPVTQEELEVLLKDSGLM